MRYKSEALKSLTKFLFVRELLWMKKEVVRKAAFSFRVAMFVAPDTFEQAGERKGKSISDL